MQQQQPIIKLILKRKQINMEFIRKETKSWRANQLMIFIPNHFGVFQQNVKNQNPKNIQTTLYFKYIQ